MINFKQHDVIRNKPQKNSGQSQLKNPRRYKLISWQAGARSIVN